MKRAALLLAAAALTWPVTAGAATLNLQVAASEQDSRESLSDHSCDYTKTDLAFGRFHQACYFPNVSGLLGATINTATFTFYATATSTVTFQGDWYAEALASPSVFTANASDLTGRSRTTATCEMDGSDLGGWTSSQHYTYSTDGTNSVAGIAQEVAALDPTAIVMIWLAVSDVGNYQAACTHDNAPSEAPKLDIDYTPLATGPDNVTYVDGAGTIAEWSGADWSALSAWCRH